MDERTKTDDGGPAFPLVGDGDNRRTVPGMSLRDYFAAHAPPMPLDLFDMSLSSEERGQGKSSPTLACLIRSRREAEWRMLYAESMLAARKSGGAA